MPGCAVAGCLSYNRKTKGTGITYHQFPRDLQLQRLWASKCYRKDHINVANATVCSLHFKSDNYVRDLKAELLNIPARKILKPDAVPCLNLPVGSSVSTSAETQVKESREERFQARASLKRALETFENISPKKLKIDQSTFADFPNVESEELRELRNRVKDLEDKNKRLETMCGVLKVRERLLREKLKVCRRRQRESQTAANNAVSNKVKDILQDIFSETQISCLLSGKKQAKWKREDICKAVTIRAISRKCYTFLRNKLNFPLPGISTLKRWSSRSFQCRPGVLSDVLHLMKAKGQSFSDIERVCVLSFDEMNVDGSVTFDEVEDRVAGPHSNVLVVMVRGLCSAWKQPIYYDFDVQMTAALLNSIVSSLYNIGYSVVAVVSDLGPKNRCVWNELNVDHVNSCFSHPQEPEKKVWVFSDVPHLYKLLRNHFLDSGIKLSCGTVVTKASIEKLLSLDNAEMKMCPKLSQFHLSVKGRERQRVSLALQLFSKTTAQAIRYLMPEEEQTADFFQLVNDSFDILNSRRIVDKKPLASAYGTNEQLQRTILNNMYLCCQTMQVGNRKQLLPFQKGLLMSINSLFGLHADLLSRGIKYILTGRLNQDCLENLFSQIRGIGRFYQHPPPKEVKHRLRLLLLGKNAQDIPLSNNSSVRQEEESQQFLSSNLLCGILPDMSEAMAMLDGEAEIQDISFPCESVAPSAVTDVECSAEGFRYLAGYIARRAAKYDNTLGTPSKELLCPPQSLLSEHGWIEFLSRGGLLVPSDRWMRQISEFELLFNQVNGPDSLSKEKNISKRLADLISQKYPHVAPEVVKIFLRTRIFIRVRYLNMKLKKEKAAAAQRRKSRQWHSSVVGRI